MQSGLGGLDTGAANRAVAETARYLLDTLIHRITRTLVHAGVLVDEESQPWLDREPTGALEEFGGAAVRYRNSRVMAVSYAGFWSDERYRMNVAKLIALL